MSKTTYGWEKYREITDLFFSPNEIKDIRKKLETLEIKHVVFCSFESRFASSGGLGAVTKKILPYLKNRKGIRRALLMTPFYPHIIDEKKLTAARTSCKVIFANETVTVEILKCLLQNDGGIEEYYLKAAGFFDSRNPIHDPYGYDTEDPQKNDDAIRRNALFFCKAVPIALKTLGIRENIIFHLQEWQTTLITLTSKKALLDGTLISCGCVQTIHNPFDSWISSESLALLTPLDKIRKHPDFSVKDGLTAYQIGLQLMDAPLTTVSEHFAGELTSDPLQTGHFAPHLRDIFNRSAIVGINNGMFIDFPQEYSQMEKRLIPEIKKIKNNKRSALLTILNTYHPPERFGELTFQSQSITQLPGHIPILVMSGRLDPFQKGFDILLRVVEKFGKDEIKVVVSPMTMNTSDLDYFHEAADRCRGNITVFPIRMKKGYQELQMGSTFGIMPSIYEPFGAAVEYMVSGTVTIARKTGGLIDQVIDNRCGYLFREKPETYTSDNIRAFAETSGNVRLRKGNPWVESMAITLADTIRKAAEIFKRHPDKYYEMIAEGFKHASTFTWEKAAEKYFQVFKKIKGV
jgi:glycogen synthase